MMMNLINPLTKGERVASLGGERHAKVELRLCPMAMLWAPEFADS
jgi:hypothetical protein